MEYKSFYKNASRGNRLKEKSNSQRLKWKRESSRQDLHFNNRNLNVHEFENDEDDDEVFYKNPPDHIPEMHREKRRRSRQKDDENKENEVQCKYQDRLARLLRFKEERARAKQNSVKKKPFVSVVPKNNLVDREYEKNLFKKTETDAQKVTDRRIPLTPAAKHAIPRVDTRRKEPLLTVEKKQAVHILNVKTPASIKKVKPKVDTWRKGAPSTRGNENGMKKEQKQTDALPRGKVTTTASSAATTSSNKNKPKNTAALNKKRVLEKAVAGSRRLITYQQVRSGQKSVKFNFIFNKDGPMVTSTNRKKKSLEKLLQANALLQQPAAAYRFSPKPASNDDDIFEGISPIDVDTPTPKKMVADSDAIAMRKRETRRRSMMFAVEDIKPTLVKSEADDEEWEPQVITISDDESPHLVKITKMSPKQINESFTKREEKVEIMRDRRPTIDDCAFVNATPKLIGSGGKTLSGRRSLIFIEDEHNPAVSEAANATQIISSRNSIGFVENSNSPTNENPIVKNAAPYKVELASPQRRSGTPRMSFIEEDLYMTKPLPEGNLATVLLNKQENRRRSSGGSSRSSLVNFREEDQSPKDVREKVTFYYDLVEKELKRLRELCDLYKDDLESEAINENGKGLIIAAQGQTNILINKKLSKFKELVGHYEKSWTDQKVRTDDLDGFWLMVSLDLENLDRRFDELRQLKDNNWQEIAEPQKVKKLKGGGGIKKREKKPMKTKASGLADLIKKAREEAKKKMMLESVLKESVTVVTPIKRSVRIATTPRRSSLVRNSLCAGCTPTPGKSDNKKSRKTIFNDHTLRRKEIVKSILKTPSEKRRAKSVLFLDSGLDTPEARGSGGRRKIIHTPKPKITFNEELEVEDVDTISLTTPYKLDEEIRKRKRSSVYVQENTNEVQPQHNCTNLRSRRKTLRFNDDVEQEVQPVEESANMRRTTRSLRRY
ncbi:uncharacterized protein LOC128734759 [Sabethes cyaneus]|uniref:uncharacterized protein LOC128734759 n=1 Tax=Sabethes cyaneus TaxID=53552 RepID=UPI00237D5717|nr:uncharacterized protein LOC128734759 [Sabethes cyaneus]